MTEENRVQVGVIEFHSPRLNPCLIERFSAVAVDLRAAACIVDLWMLDIATVLSEHGYDLRIYRTLEAQRRSEQQPTLRCVSQNGTSSSC